MISLVLYGRNDSYGYNLHKRAAISLNCMAEVLTDADDEILFVDYNTPDDFPTFPEAIQDTLTAKAKMLLRILRVRPRHHERFAAKTHLVALEPISRNVAIRRSNPNNRWILSTNTDMVFVPRRGRSISEIARELPDAYYHLPRFEVPETLWEGVDRMNARATIAAFEAWGRAYHLNEVVYAQDPEVLYDAPGDFQLILRSDAWRIFGFNESMLLGWHVDSNMAKRLSLLPREVGDLVDEIYGYHCDHTRQVTPMHRPQGTQNDLKVYFEFVRSAAVNRQARTWGLAGETIEELSLTEKQTYAAALSAATPRPLEETSKIHYAGATYNQIDYDPEHVLPFLADGFSSYPRDTVLAWAGAKRALLHGFARVWCEMGFSEPILVISHDRWLGPELPRGCIWASAAQACRRASAFVFDWGKPESATLSSSWLFDRDPIIQQVALDFRLAYRSERNRRAKGVLPPRRFIAVNAINNAMEGIFSNHIGAARTPIATRIRQGYITAVDAYDPGNPANLLTSLYIGEAGQRLQSGILPLRGKRGFVFFGPYLDLDSSIYRLSIEFERVLFQTRDWTALTLDVVSNSKLIACREITKKDLRDGRVDLEFFLAPEIADNPDWPRVEFRLRTPGGISFRIRKVELRDCTAEQGPDLTDEIDIAPLLITGPAGKRDGEGVHARGGVAGLVTYGPYFWLSEGRYEAEFRCKIEDGATTDPIRVYVAWHLGRVALGKATIVPRRPGVVSRVIPFQITGKAPPPEFGLLEFIVWSRGKARFTLQSVKVRPSMAVRAHRTVAVPDMVGLLPLLAVKRSGRLLPGAILALAGEAGVVFKSAKLPLPAGCQRLQLKFRQLRSRGSRESGTGLRIEARNGRRVIARREIDERDVKRGKTALDFDVVTEAWGEEIELVMLTKGYLELEITSAQLMERAASRGLQAPEEMVARSP